MHNFLLAGGFGSALTEQQKVKTKQERVSKEALQGTCEYPYCFQNRKKYAKNFELHYIHRAVTVCYTYFVLY